MTLEQQLASKAPDQDTLLTIGVFDGVHLGHRYLISRVKEQATERGLLSGVVTFDPHPQEVVAKKSRLAWLTDVSERVALLRELGIELVITLSFTSELAQLSARDFISLLQKYLRMRGLVIGPDFALGRNREGTTDKLRTMGEEMGFTVEVVLPVVINGGMVSSTSIRQMLANGDVGKFRKMVGRYFTLPGKVVSGAERGQTLGFPTANLDLNPGRALPGEGVYAALSYIGNGIHPSVINIGRRPTFGGGGVVAEVYILDYKGNLYGHQLTVNLVERLRGEIKFETAGELKAQIAMDVERTKMILDSSLGGDNA